MSALGWVFLAVACSGPSTPELPIVPPQAAAPGVFERTTQTGKYAVTLRFVPPTPSIGELFAVEATVVDRVAGVPLENGKLALDARMPQHNHGMETDPVDLPGVCDAAGACTHPGGAYRTEGFKLHMGGAWTVTIDVSGPQGPDSTTLIYDLR